MPPATYVCKECRHLILTRVYQCRSRASRFNTTFAQIQPLRALSRSSFYLTKPAQRRSFSAASSCPQKSTQSSREGHVSTNEGEALATTSASRSHTEAQNDEIRENTDESQHDLVDRTRLHVDDPEDIDLNGVEEEDATEHLTQEEVFQIARSSLDPEQVAQYARRRFGDRLPEGALTSSEYEAYVRMYGKPLEWSEDLDEVEELDDVDDSELTTGLYKEMDDGSLEEIEMMSDEQVRTKDSDQSLESFDVRRTRADNQLQDDIVHSLDREEDDHAMRAFLGEADPTSSEPRAHPFTLASRSGTFPSTINISRNAMVGPVTAIVADFPNRHLDETAAKIFGGPGLPYATGFPLSSRQLRQKPIPMLSSHARMTATEANVYTVALWPGMYSSIFSVLVELRRRLGSSWIQNLFDKPDGPSILDTGSAGAGVLAWREVLRAEWERLHPEATQGKKIPVGKATVLTASSSLRARASALLEDTTFLPRLPDYIHITDFRDTAPRKQFDIIVAPHTLWHIEEEFLRRQYVDNLWSMLNPSGGILILLEKGVPRGFEVVADARQHLLRNLFTNSPLSRAKEDNYMSNEYEPPNFASSTSSISSPVRRGEASIIAPCTTHEKCPLYTVQGVSKQRKDFCRFEQRYIRPPYYQRMLGAKDRNHEDVPFSYVAIQRGRSIDSLINYGRTTPTAAPLDGLAATERAFEGYDIYDEDLESMHPGTRHEASVTAVPSADRAPSATTDTPAGRIQPDPLITPEPQTLPPSPFTLPRLVLPPLKRHGHVMLDVCTPAGTLERWTVPRSFGKQAYRDARKAQWGDLWALGAKLRIARNVRLGSKGGETIIAPAARIQEKQTDEENDDGDDGDGADRGTAKKAIGGKTKREDKIKGREKRRFEKRMAKRENRSKMERSGV